jgi:hypothetical protein
MNPCGAVAAPHLESEAEADRKLDHSHIHEPRAGVLTRAMVRWSLDDWQTMHQTATTDTGRGIHFADLSTDQLPPDRRVRFTFFWLDAQRWEGGDFEITVAAER